jgi:hypothetical protein
MNISSNLHRGRKKKKKKGENGSKSYKIKMPWRKTKKVCVCDTIGTKLTATLSHAVTEQKLNLFGFCWER